MKSIVTELTTLNPKKQTNNPPTLQLQLHKTHTDKQPHWHVFHEKGRERARKSEKEREEGEKEQRWL